MNLTPAEMRLIGRLLDMAADEFSNHGCNDMLWPADFPAEERAELVRRMERDNDPNVSPEEVEESVTMRSGRYSPGDHCLMRYFSGVMLRAGGAK
jgi:hypothetical protein